MLRIILVMEDLTQMNALKVVLSKLGCIVETASVELGFRDRIVNFRPEVVITAGSGRKVSPHNVLQRTRELGRETKVFLLMGAGGSGLDQGTPGMYSFDEQLEAPVEPLSLLAKLNPLSKSKTQIDLVEKYQKISAISLNPTQEIKLVTGKAPSLDSDPVSTFGTRFSSSRGPKERAEAFAKLTEGLKLGPDSGISKSKAKARWDELKKSWENEDSETLDEERRRFVKELFRKK